MRKDRWNYSVYTHWTQAAKHNRSHYNDIGPQAEERHFFFKKFMETLMNFNKTTTQLTQ